MRWRVASEMGPSEMGPSDNGLYIYAIHLNIQLHSLLVIKEKNV